MEYLNRKYYEGFEGEPEIQFICTNGNSHKVYIIWEGYFDEIMRLMEPNDNGWTGLAYFYNMYLGWYEESPWEIKDLKGALKQFELIDDHQLCDKAQEILALICDILRKAIFNNFKVFIARD